MKNFDQYTRNQQTSWRREHLENQTPGEHNKKRYPFILPRKDWHYCLWEGIQASSSNPLVPYLNDNNIDHHTGVHNLRSSWALCANLYFPFREDKALAANFLRKNVSADIVEVVDIQLEYAAAPPYDPKTLLGEPEGTRGKNQTSPDVAFIYKATDGKGGIVLVENKYIEHSFYPCSGRKPQYGNPDARRCLDFHAVHEDLNRQCYLRNWQATGRENRKYWDYITISETGKRILKKCPAAVAGYQLFRQQALAEAFIRSGRFSQAISCVAYDVRNETLQGCLKTTGIESIERWGDIFAGKAQFRTFTHQQWVQFIADNDSTKRWRGWLEYIHARYQFPISNI
ncbi:PGN_0703 family putative restriction endonuclease [Geomonas azotofigens]|uniref:PGN_0703 family putative restriction endonuclease n=1 Tax=Geomonas azotofigens TaxID=2843196 RepID=UPI001C0F948B|nr:hypothetical protein [Geomonas azotofigens]MBU5614463.1 hypothetical protein [Geomonas azotofigens]